MATPIGIGSFADTSGSFAATSLTTTAAVPAGALIVVAIHDDDNTAGPGISAVSDTAGNTYTRTVSQALNSSVTSEFWHKENCAALPSGDTISVTMTSGDAFCAIIQAAYCTGVLTTLSLDKTNSAHGSGSVPTGVSSGVLGQAAEIVFGALCKITAAGTLTESTGFTTLNAFVDGQSADADGCDLAFDSVNATTAVNYNPGYSVATNWSLLIATFKLTAASAQVPYTPYRQLGPILAQRAMLGWEKLFGKKTSPLWKPQRPPLWLPTRPRLIGVPA